MDLVNTRTAINNRFQRLTRKQRARMRDAIKIGQFKHVNMDKPTSWSEDDIVYLDALLGKYERGFVA